MTYCYLSSTTKVKSTTLATAFENNSRLPGGDVRQTNNIILNKLKFTRATGESNITPLFNSESLKSKQVIAFIDPTIPQAQTLISGVLPDVEVIVLQPNGREIEQITQVLSQRQVEAVHLVSHGESGCLQLGQTRLDEEMCDRYTQDLQAWFKENSQTPSLLLYGCNVASGNAGKQFLEKIQGLTGANIAATNSLTGSASLGGNWELETQLGNIGHKLRKLEKSQENLRIVRNSERIGS